MKFSSKHTHDQHWRSPFNADTPCWSLQHSESIAARRSNISTAVLRFDALHGSQQYKLCALCSMCQFCSLCSIIETVPQVAYLAFCFCIFCIFAFWDPDLLILHVLKMVFKQHVYGAKWRPSPAAYKPRSLGVYILHIVLILDIVHIVHILYVRPSHWHLTLD